MIKKRYVIFGKKAT